MSCVSEFFNLIFCDERLSSLTKVVITDCLDAKMSSDRFVTRELVPSKSFLINMVLATFFPSVQPLLAFCKAKNLHI